MASLPSISSTAAFVSMVAGLVVEDVAFAATNKPVAGVGIKVCKRPGGGSARTKATTSDANGNFSFTGLEAGNYEVTVGNGAVQMFIVGEDGMLSGAAVQDTTTRAVQTNGPVLRPRLGGYQYAVGLLARQIKQMKQGPFIN